MFEGLFVRNGKLFTPFFAAGGQHPATIGGSHSFAKTMLVLSFSPGWLVRAFHVASKLRAAKMIRIFLFTKVKTGKVPWEGLNKRFFHGLGKWSHLLSLQSVLGYWGGILGLAGP